MHTDMSTGTCVNSCIYIKFIYKLNNEYTRYVVIMSVLMETSAKLLEISTFVGVHYSDIL